MMLGRLIALNCRRAFLSWRFGLSVLAISAVLFFIIAGHISASSFSSVIYFMSVTRASTGVISLYAGLIPLFPFALSFATDWQDHATHFWLIRSGTRAYTVSQYLVALISAFATTFCGYGLLTLILSTMLPYYVPSNQLSEAYAVIISCLNAPVLYSIVEYAHLSLSSMLFAGAAYWMSTIVPDPFVAAASPMVMYLVGNRLTIELPIPRYLKVVGWVEGIYDVGGPLKSWLLKLAIVGSVCMIFGLVAVRNINRRVKSA